MNVWRGREGLGVYVATCAKTFFSCIDYQRFPPHIHKIWRHARAKLWNATTRQKWLARLRRPTRKFPLLTKNTECLRSLKNPIMSTSPKGYGRSFQYDQRKRLHGVHISEHHDRTSTILSVQTNTHPRKRGTPLERSILTGASGISALA